MMLELQFVLEFGVLPDELSQLEYHLVLLLLQADGKAL